MLARTDLKTGPGIPIVFLHGFLGSSLDWIPLCSHLPPSPCIAFDLPGHGASPFSETFDIPLDLFHLVGYSMGGRLALRYAFENPRKVASLTLLSAHPGLASEAEKEKRLAHDAEWAHLLLTLPIDEFLSRWYAQSVFQSYKPDLTLRKKQNLPELAASLLHYSLGRQPHYDTSHARVLVGERDERYRQLHPSAHIIPGAGHMIHLENPAACASALLGSF